jgi:hypothetical protein
VDLQVSFLVSEAISFIRFSGLIQFYRRIHENEQEKERENEKKETDIKLI